MSETLARAIVGMTSADPEVRVVSATEIYRTGRALTDHAVYPWWAEAELAGLLEAPNPFVTVGLAVAPERFAAIHEASSSPRMADIPAEQDAQEFELHLPGGLSLDVLTSRDPEGNGPIAKYLRKFGEGIQQVEIRCKNVNRATQLLQETFELTAIYPEARAGADGARINFFLVAAPGEGKLLIELYEPAQRMA